MKNLEKDKALPNMLIYDSTAKAVLHGTAGETFTEKIRRFEKSPRLYHKEVSWRQ